MSLAKLQDDVYAALKSWHEVTAATTPLNHLRLYQQARLTGAANARQAANEILLEALEALAVDHQRDADLLRKHFLDGVVMHALANWLNVGESTAYRLQKEAIKRLAQVIQAREALAQAEHRLLLETRLEPRAYDRLIGVEDHLNHLLDRLSVLGPPWLVAIEGLGGLGKTSLADALSRRVINEGVFADFGWVSARQQSFNPGGGIKPIERPALTTGGLVEKLLAQLLPTGPKAEILSSQEALVTLRARLKQSAHLVVIDNLETVLDLETLLPTLRDLVDPSKFLLTSRQSLHHEAGLYHFSLPELSQANALRLIRSEAQLNNLPHLAQAGDDSLRRIFEVAGGNPLALRLVIGQTHVHALDVILDDLVAARGQKAEMLYAFIYRRAWDNLDEITRQVLLAMPLVTNHGGSLAYLAALTGLAPAGLRDALGRLAALNLVDSKGDLSERRYTIHNLTRAFLQEQVIRWQ